MAIAAAGLVDVRGGLRRCVCFLGPTVPRAGARQRWGAAPFLLCGHGDGDREVNVCFLGQCDGTNDLTQRRVVDRRMALGSVRYDLSADVMADHGRGFVIFNTHRVFAPFNSDRHSAQRTPQAFDHLFYFRSRTDERRRYRENVSREAQHLPFVESRLEDLDSL